MIIMVILLHDVIKIIASITWSLLLCLFPIIMFQKMTQHDSSKLEYLQLVLHASILEQFQLLLCLFPTIYKYYYYY
jgi:hypothetical protein